MLVEASLHVATTEITCDYLAKLQLYKPEDLMVPGKKFLLICVLLEPSTETFIAKNGNNPLSGEWNTHASQSSNNE